MSDQRTIQQNKEFIQVDGFPYYEINRCGEIASKERIVTQKWVDGRTVHVHRKRKILKHLFGGTGYATVNLFNGDKQVTMNVHRIVAEHFIPNPHNKPQVNHIDGDKSNCHIDNLEWVTASENGKHAYSVLGIKTHLLGLYGKEHPTSKCVLQKDTDGKIIKKWDCALDAVKAHNFDSGCISRCCNGESKTHKGFIWEFA